MVEVGGTAAALHAHHRYTIDALDTQKIGNLLVPTPEEALRIKAYLLTERGAMRDFIDVAALSDLIGPDRSIASLKHLNELYEPSGQLTRLSTFSQAVFETPRDFDETVLDPTKVSGPRTIDGST
jgi:hypothetical protein